VGQFKISNGNEILPAPGFMTLVIPHREDQSGIIKKRREMRRTDGKAKKKKKAGIIPGEGLKEFQREIERKRNKRYLGLGQKDKPGKKEKSGQ